MSGLPRALSQLLLAFALVAVFGADPWLGVCLAVGCAMVFPAAPWRPLPAARALGCYVVWLVVWVVFAVTYLRVTAALGHPVAPQRQLLALAEQGVSLPGFWLQVTLIVVVAPVFEELLFRGYLFAAVERALPSWGTQAVVATLFGLAHGLAHALPIGVLSLVFGYLRQRHGSLLPSMLAHAAHNGITVTVVVCWPGTLDLLYAR